MTKVSTTIKENSESYMEFSIMWKQRGIYNLWTIKWEPYPATDLLV